MKFRKIINFMLILSIFLTLIGQVMALELDEVLIKTPREGQLLRSTKVPVSIIAKSAVTCEYTVTNEETDDFIDDDVAFDAPEIEGRKKVNRLAIDIEGILGDRIRTERETRRGTLILSSFPEQEYSLEITCRTVDEEGEPTGDDFSEEVSFLVKPRGATVVRED